MRKYTLLLLAVLPYTVSAQYLKGSKADAQIAGAQEINYNDRTMAPSFVKFRNDQRPDISGFAQLSKTVFNMRSEDQLEQVKVSRPDALQMRHYTYQQKYNGVPVEWAVTKVHEKDGKIVSMNGEFHQDMNVSNSVSISESQALEAAKSNIGAVKYKWEMKEEEAFLKKALNKPDFSYDPKMELVVLPMGKEVYKYAYRFDIYAHEPDGRWDVYVDAENGTVLNKISKICDADVKGSAQTRYHGLLPIMTDSLSPTSFRLRENNRKGRGMQIETLNAQRMDEGSNPIDFTDGDNFWNNVNGFKDDAATDAHFAIENTYDFYYDSLGRDSYDDNGSKLTLFLHVEQNWFNAQWTGSYSRYGDGDGDPLTSIDVVGHETTHGVTQETADLIYQSESGALNESFSDIFGTAIEFFALPATAKWVVGEGNFRLRDMSNPNAFDNPDTYGGINWTDTEDCTPDPFNDWCGVHNNSGVQNFWYYLLVNGGTGTNDLGNAYNVTGIGQSKAIRIAYRNLSEYLTSTSDYRDARFYSIQAAIDLYGGDSPEVISVTNAWYAVGVGKAYSLIPEADFRVKNIQCVPGVPMLFSNESGSASSYLWSFGDNTTSTAVEPTHAYASSGLYTVRLIATNINGSDTLTRTNYIGIYPDEPALTNCTANAHTPFAQVGIYNVNFGTINNTSLNAIKEGGYMDFTCSRTDVESGEMVPITITTSESNSVFTRVWIDWNNDGDFNAATELAFSTDATTKTHTGNVNIPTDAVLGTPLRMRVVSSRSVGNTPNEPCATVKGGQIEDYAVYVTNNSGVRNGDLAANLRIYPNPAHSDVRVELSNASGKSELILTDMLGKEIFRKEFQENTSINVGDLPKSLYFIKIKSENQQVVQKIIVE